MTSAHPVGPLRHGAFPAAIEVKLRPPSASPSQVVRHAIVDLVCAERAARLVLIRAPAGFGKTTTMLQCRNRLQEGGVRTAWLTLDRADNDASRFLSCLTAALSGLVDDGGETLAQDDALLTLMAGLAASKVSFALFIDELEVIREPGVVGLLREMIAGLPVGGQVVIGTRSVPDLSLGRLRARGHLLEIDAQLLRFSEAETGEFISERRGIALDERDRMLLHRKTEGWVAGLWLASAALARHASHSDFIARFSGSNVAVAEYLADDVLDQQPPAVRSFLLRTSILRELDASLCQALVPGMDADALLQRLEAENVLVTPIEGEVRSYRYHGLFAGFLKAQLMREMPDEIPGLHACAARWYEENGRPVRAVDHAVQGGDFPNALRILEAHAMDLLNAGRLRLLSRWLGAIPGDLMARHPRLRVVQLWAIGFTRGPWEALAELDRSGLDASGDRDVQAHVMALRPVLLATMDREEGYRLGLECLARLPTGITMVDSALLSTLAAVSVVRRRPDEALRLLDFRRQILGGLTSGMGDMHAECILGTVAMIEGRLAEATTHFRTAVTTTPSRSLAFTKGNAWAGILYALVVYEGGALDDVRNLLQVYVPIARDAGIPDHVTLGYRMLCRLAFDRGDVDQAFNALTELETFGYQRQYPRVVAGARLERARLQLMQGHVEAARDELERGSDRAVWAAVEHLNLIASEVEYPELCRLRWEACAGDASAAADAIGLEITKALSDRRLHRALGLRILRVGALERSGDRVRARQEFLDVASACCREGFFRIVADEAPLIGPILRLLPDEAGAGDPVEPKVADWLRRLRRATDATGHGDDAREGRDGAAGTAHPDALSGVSTPLGLAPEDYRRDPLTPKEQRILKLLAEGYSNAAMSEKLFVSDSTVRTHLRNINSKLGVRSRMQAVLAARRLGLLH